MSKKEVKMTRNNLIIQLILHRFDKEIESESELSPDIGKWHSWEGLNNFSLKLFQKFIIKIILRVASPPWQALKILLSKN